MADQTPLPTPADVLAFWRDAGPAFWFKGGEAFDARCREVLGAAHMAAARRELDHWMGDAEGALALVLLLDQISRNIFRGSGHAFATDGLARLHAEAAIAAGFDLQADPALRQFFYMPFEHSESLADQQRSVALFEALGDADYLDYARRHLDPIARFGRFPHRNPMLGRNTTAEEQAYLDAGGGF